MFLKNFIVRDVAGRIVAHVPKNLGGEYIACFVVGTIVGGTVAKFGKEVKNVGKAALQGVADFLR